LKELIKICKVHNQHALKEYLRKEVSKFFRSKNLKNTKNYLYCRGTIPVLVVAHLDTVHRLPVESVWQRYDDNMIITSPQGIGGDDRCGVYIIMQLLKSGLRPSVLFTTDEESGAYGAQAFCKNIKKLNVNFILEFDRRGCNDVVRYNDDNDALLVEIEKFGFKEAFGSFSDISWLCPHFGISGVNLSSGYYKAHTTQEYINFREVLDIIKRAKRILLTKELVSKKFIYKESYTRFDTYTDYSRYPIRSYYDSIYKDYTLERVKLCDYCDAYASIYAVNYGHLCIYCAQELDLIVCPHCDEVVEDYKYTGVCEHCNKILDDDDVIKGKRLLSDKNTWGDVYLGRC
jgi:hypothetical protein